MALTLHGTVSDNTVALDRKTATPLIINGDMQIAQRGTSFTGITSGNTYGLDRQVLTISGLGTWTMSQESDAPTGQGFSKSLKLDCTTAQASPTASNNLRLNYRLEGQDLQLLKKGTSNAEAVTISFWVKSAKTGTYILELFDGDNLRQISQAYTISSANTWEKKVVSFAGDTTGALDNDNELSLYLFFWLGAGTDWTSGTLNTSWASSTNANRAVGQVNLADSTSNDWYMTGLQLEVGAFDANSIPPFQFEDRGTSLMRCMRYFERITTSGGGDTFGAGVCFVSTQARVDVRYSTVKRANATITLASASNFLVQAGNKTQAPTSLGSAGSSLHGFFCHCAVSGFTIGHGAVLLDNGTTDATIDVNAEL